MNNREKAETLANRPYTMETRLDQTTDGETIYIANAIEIEGCYGQGDSPTEARKDLKLAIIDFIESLLDDGLSVPSPIALRLVSNNKSNTNSVSYKFVRNGSKLEAVEQNNNVDSYLFSTQV